jgi:hypothetical protein
MKKEEIMDIDKKISDGAIRITNNEEIRYVTDEQKRMMAEHDMYIKRK